MRAGHRHKTWIKIQQLSKVPYAFDDDPAVWEDVYTLRASIQPTSSTELVSGSKIEAQTTHNILIRYLPGILSSMRILVDDQTLDGSLDGEGVPAKRVFEIDEIVNVGDRMRDLELRCIERKSTGSVIVIPPDEQYWVWQNDDDHIWAGVGDFADFI